MQAAGMAGVLMFMVAEAGGREVILCSCSFISSNRISKVSSACRLPVQRRAFFCVYQGIGRVSIYRPPGSKISLILLMYNLNSEQF